MQIAIIGAGPAGLYLGSALARRGHHVVAVDRDAGPDESATWERRGVMQFHHAHAFRQTVVDSLGREVPEAVDLWRGAGAEPIEFTPPGGRLTTLGLRSRRETFERALRTAATATPGFTVRQGHVDGVVSEGGRAAGLMVDGVRLDADLVIDASGRAGRATRDLGERAGVGGPCGQAYVDRVYRLRPGAEPGPMTNPIAWNAEFDGYLSLIFRHERGYFSVLIVRRDTDHELRGLRHAHTFEAATRAIPGLDVWTDPERSEPVTDVLAGGALLNVYRGQTTTEGELVLPGLFFVGDSVATTTPVYGRGLTTTLWQCESLLSLLDQDSEDLAGVGLAFDEWSTATMRPWVEDHIHLDTARVARWNGADIDVDAPLPSDLILAAAEVRPEIMGSAQGYLSMAAPPASLRAAEPIAREVYAGGWRPPYAPGPTRDELAALVAQSGAETVGEPQPA
jgi:2-polyprenyl-6-methoxyphenol hydroxylase-like FAD-dependent oxidoreductase